MNISIITEPMRSLVLLIFLGVAAVAPPALAAPFFGKPMTSQGPLHFVLQDATGQERRLADFRGRVVAVVFGYTHCPDYCPTTLARLAGAARLVGSTAAFVPIFVTVDPERDTPPMLGAYVKTFHPALLGLRGDATRTAEAARHFRVLFEKVAEAGGDYSIDHSGGIFLVDRKGTLRLKEPDNLDVKKIAQDIRSLLEEK